MSSAVVVSSAQLPRVDHRPPAIGSPIGREAVDLAASYGLHLDPWQVHAVEAAFAERPGGRWAAFEVGMLVPRQNGKGAVLEAIELAALFLLEERVVLHTAHEFKTSLDAFRRIRAIIDGHDDLRREVRAIRVSNGSEGIEFLDGRQLRFVARSKSSGRGFSVDRLILDEAQELSTLAVEALMPTMAARPNPQVIYTGTVPTAQNDAEHFESVRNRGRRIGDPSLTWMEWSPDPDGVVDLDDRDLWAATNPGMPLRVSLEHIERERATLTDEGFARERLAHWPDVPVGSVIDLDEWSALADMEPDRPKPVALAVEVTRDRRWSRIALAGMRADGHRHVQLVDSRKGTGWVAGRVAELVAKYRPVTVANNPGGPAGSLVPHLAEQGVDIMPLTGRDVAQAAASFVDAVAERTLHHPGDRVLDVAVAAAGQRFSGGSWVFHPLDGQTDISPLDAVSLALWGLTKSTTQRRRTGQVVGIR